MTRIALTDGTNRWFDADKAELIKEDTFWNGNNWISKATGSQWEHEALYRTRGGKWILNHSSSYQGVPESYTEINSREAAEWLAKQQLEPHEACEKDYADLEIE